MVNLYFCRVTASRFADPKLHKFQMWSTPKRNAQLHSLYHLKSSISNIFFFRHKSNIYFWNWPPKLINIFGLHHVLGMCVMKTAGNLVVEWKWKCIPLSPPTLASQEPKSHKCDIEWLFYPDWGARFCQKWHLRDFCLFRNFQVK